VKVTVALLSAVAAVTRAVPTRAAVARPHEAASLETLTTPPSDDVQVTVDVRSAVVLSL